MRSTRGRVGRTAAAKALDPEVVDLAVQAHVRHELTDYDDHLSAGMERREQETWSEPTWPGFFASGVIEPLSPKVW